MKPQTIAGILGVGLFLALTVPVLVEFNSKDDRRLDGLYRGHNKIVSMNSTWQANLIHEKEKYSGTPLITLPAWCWQSLNVPEEFRYELGATDFWALSTKQCLWAKPKCQPCQLCKTDGCSEYPGCADCCGHGVGLVH